MSTIKKVSRGVAIATAAAGMFAAASVPIAHAGEVLPSVKGHPSSNTANNRCMKTANRCNGGSGHPINRIV